MIFGAKSSEEEDGKGLLGKLLRSRVQDAVHSVLATAGDIWTGSTATTDVAAIITNLDLGRQVFQGFGSRIKVTTGGSGDKVSC